MKTSTKLLIAIYCLITYSTLAQISPPADFSWKIQNKETVTTFYIADQSTSLTTLDKSQLKKTRDVRLIEKYYAPDTKVPFTIIHKIESQNIYKDWMIKPFKFIIDSSGITSFDSLGNILKSISHSEKYNQAVENNSGNVFKSLEEDIAIQTQNTPGDVFISPEENIIITKPNTTLIYNLTEKTKSTILYNEIGDTINTINTQYASVQSFFPSHPNQKDLIPVYKKEVKRKFLPSGACVKFVTLKKYQDYKINENTNPQFRFSNKKPELKSYPNPALNSITILNTDDSNLFVKIYNLQGQLIKKINLINKSEIDISELHKGIYLLSIQSNKSESISKFIKL